MLPIETIQSLCALALTNVGGLRRITITDVSNYKLGAVVAGAEAFTIAYRDSTARYADDPKRDQGGTVLEQKLVAIVPRKRAAMEVLRRQLHDRSVLIECIDWNGDIHVITSAMLLIAYQTGDELRSSNHYQIQADGVSLNRGFDITSVTDSLFGNEGTPGGGTDMGTDTTPVGGGGTTPNTDVYAQVVTTPLPAGTTIPPTGNTTNLNKFITITNGDRYFIDIYGRAMNLCCGDPTTGDLREVIYIDGTGTDTYQLIATVDTDYSDKNLLIDRNGVVMRRVTTPTKINEYTYVGDDIVLATAWPLEVGERLRSHILGNVTAQQVISVTGTNASSYPVTASVPTDYADENMIVDRNGVVMRRSANPSDIYEYNYSGGNIVLSPNWPLETTEDLRVHFLKMP